MHVRFTFISAPELNNCGVRLYRKPTLEGVNRMAKKTDRELIDTGTDKRYVRRDEKGQFKESDDVGRSLSRDRQQEAKRKVSSGQGDRGDQKR